MINPVFIRMPRRRKSVHSNKAPLIFTESPVNKQSNLPSPVYCARHPLTAKSVPIEDLQDLTWISPQFQNGAVSTKKQRRKRRSTSGPKCTCHCGANSLTLKGNTHNNKFKPLKFVGEKTPPVTIIEDVTFSSEEDDIDDIDISQKSTSPCLNRSQTALRRQSRPRPSRRKQIRSQPIDKYISDGDQPVNKHPEDNDFSEDNFNIGNASFHTPVTNMIHRNVPVVLNDENSQIDNINSDLDNSAQTPVNKIPSPVKRLFTSLNNSPETNVFTLIKNRKTGINNKRQSNRLLKNLCNMTTCVSPSQNKDIKSKVLAADTPESEYGIPYRLRRLKHLKKR